MGIKVSLALLLRAIAGNWEQNIKDQFGWFKHNQSSQDQFNLKIMSKTTLTWNCGNLSNIKKDLLSSPDWKTEKSWKTYFNQIRNRAFNKLVNKRGLL